MMKILFHENLKPEDKRPPKGGWAPGDYIGMKCRVCGCQFCGDKRAYECADCAYANPSQNRPPSCDKLAEDKPATLKECPVCGESPESARHGTHLEIWCCLHISAQKSDYLTIDERQTWDDDKHLYSAEAEQKCWGIISEQWNSIPRRSEVAELLRLVDDAIISPPTPAEGRLLLYANKLRKEWKL